MKQLKGFETYRPTASHSTAALYTDGGVMGASRSAIGGSWAWVRANAGIMIKRDSGLALTCPAIPSITNNYTEMLALYFGLRDLPDDWMGTVYCDSLITLGRAFGDWQWNKIPRSLHEQVKKQKERLVNWDCLGWVLLQGHPTKKELAAGVGDRGYPVSMWNVLCDTMCGEQIAGYKKRMLAAGVPA